MQLHGEAHPKHKLTENDVRAIRLAVANGMQQKDAARRWGVSKSVVGQIVHRQIWRHVMNEEKA